MDMILRSQNLELSKWLLSVRTKDEMDIWFDGIWTEQVYYKECEMK